VGFSRLDRILHSHWARELRLILERVERKIDQMGAGLTALQAADAALIAEVTAFLADVVTALQNADSDTAVAAVATDVQNAVTNLQNGDPVTGLNPGT
jgi:endonuclease/exonuclease/phosphatase family metal-dependent hydrolase